jgi:hypothetical protein
MSQLDPSKLEAHERAAVLKEVFRAYATALTCGAWDGGTMMPGTFIVRNEMTLKPEVTIIVCRLVYIETMPVPAGKLVSPGTTLDGEHMVESCNTGWLPKELGDNPLWTTSRSGSNRCALMIATTWSTWSTWLRGGRTRTQLV